MMRMMEDDDHTWWWWWWRGGFIATAKGVLPGPYSLKMKEGGSFIDRRLCS